MTSPKAVLGALFLAFALALSVPAQRAQAQQEAPIIRVLLKSDAKSLFFTPRAAWVEKVDALVAAGHGSAKGSAASGLILVMDTGIGAILTLMPRYGNGEERPDAIEFSIAYKYPQAGLISDVQLAVAVSDGERELRPEYVATGRYERTDGGILVTFVIVEAG